MNNSIAAIATASGTGGIAVIRISGGDALGIAKKMFGSDKAEFEPNRMYPGKIRGDGFEDYGFMVFFRAPKSFTGEDVVEFHCHGGVQLAHGILSKAVALGARLAERGEFTRRAFLNGKLSLAAAEGVADMINAESLALVRAGGMLYFGKLSSEVQELQSRLKTLLASIAVRIDYPEEDEDGTDFAAINAELNELSGKISRLLESYKSGRKLKSGVTVAICGKPNAGKSSLLNAILGYDKAIVSDEAGTTRDAVEGEADIEGVRYNFIDTAGIRERAGTVERIGIERAKNIILSADIVLSVNDGNGFAELPENISGKILKVFNKCDVASPRGDCEIAVSAKTGEGLDELRRLISRSCVGEFAADKAYIVEERHYVALRRAAEALASAAENICVGTLDMISVDLKEAWEALGEITGETATEEIISTIFAKFCVGK